MNAVVRHEQPGKALTAGDMRHHVNLIQEVMQSVMKEKTHFGVIPGTQKPSLWKPGAEVLCATFRIAPQFRAEDLSTDEVVRYRVTCAGVHQLTGVTLGEGMGECSSNEEKYKWRKAVNKAEFEATPENRRRVKYAKDYSVNQIRTEPADVANTILKMACKRAQVAMTLNVTAASDIFTQDIEDLPEEMRGVAEEEGGETRTVQQPQRRSATASQQGNINEQQAKTIRSTLAKKEVGEQELLTKFGIAAVEDLPFDRLNEALNWIGNPS